MNQLLVGKSRFVGGLNHDSDFSYCDFSFTARLEVLIGIIRLSIEQRGDEFSQHARRLSRVMLHHRVELRPPKC